MAFPQCITIVRLCNILPSYLIPPNYCSHILLYIIVIIYYYILLLLYITIYYYYYNSYYYSLTGKQQKVTPKFGRQSCANPDNPVKVQNFPAGDDPHAPEQLAQMFSLTRKEVMALMGRLYGV